MFWGFDFDVDPKMLPSSKRISKHNDVGLFSNKNNFSGLVNYFTVNLCDEILTPNGNKSSAQKRIKFYV